MRLIDADELLEKAKEELYPEKFGEKCNALDVIYAFAQLIEESPTISAISTENCSNGIKTMLAGMKETFKACGL